jgi:DNA-binding CsgD family transcriptional regulator
MRDEPGPLPGQASGWPEAQVLAFHGRHREASELVWAGSERLWARGARFSAALGLLIAVEIQPDDERLRVASARAAEVGGGLLASHVALLRAQEARDPDALVAAFDSLRAAGRHGLALSALRKAAELYAARGDAQRASMTEARAEAFAESLAPRWLDTARFVSKAAPLTERELEVARLVAKGMSNPEVADSLVLSVRTVESHMNRIMRKLNVSSRQAVKWFIDSRAVT